MIISKQEFLDRAQLDRETLEVWIEEEWLVPSGSAPEVAFSEADVARAELIRDLMQDLGVNDEGVGVILNLLDQMHGLRRALADTLQSVRQRSALPTQSTSERPIGWLRAAVLGANDGIISTASLIVGVAAAAASHSDVLIAGVAALVAGAMSMAAGEYVSVSSQSDTEQADLARERKELSENADFELDELAEIYVKRGVDQALARQVAQQLMAKDALTAHAHDELGISEITTARPVQAALASAVMFSVGAAMPLLMVVVSPASALVPIVSAASLGFLALLGAIGARAGGANILRGTARVTFWGALAMALTAGIGKLFGTVV